MKGDKALENNETFYVMLSSAVGATITKSQGVGTILNDDPPAVLTVPYSQNFSAGLPGGDLGWEYYSTAEGRIVVASGQLRMDDKNNNSVYSLNEAIFHVNLANQTGVQLKLDHITSGDETETYAGSQFIGHVNADLIALSADGSHWVKVTDLGSNFAQKSFALDSILAMAATAAGSSDLSNVRIKLQQYDNQPRSSDGRAFDNIQLTATPLAALMASTAETAARTNRSKPLDPEGLASMVDAAIAQWASAGLNSDVLARLQATKVSLADLPGRQLGIVAADRVFIDSDAAGNGWFLDTTPSDDEEFAWKRSSAEMSAVDARATDRMDLLTVVMHELGHVAGLSDESSSARSLMSATLPRGVRRVPRFQT